MLKQATVFYFGMNYGRAKKEKEKKKRKCSDIIELVMSTHRMIRAIDDFHVLFGILLTLQWYFKLKSNKP